MDLVKNRLDSIRIKAKQLALKVERLEKENEFLSKKLEQLEAKKGKIHIAQVSKSTPLADNEVKINPSDTASIRKMKKEVKQYIKEIEKCIEWVKEV